MVISKELLRYKGAKIFSPEANKTFKPGEIIGPVTMGLEQWLFGVDEIAVLKRGPRFCVRRILCRERFMMEMEKCFCKIRLSKRDKDPDDEAVKKKESEEEGEGKSRKDS